MLDTYLREGAIVGLANGESVGKIDGVIVGLTEQTSHECISERSIKINSLIKVLVHLHQRRCDSRLNHRGICRAT